MIKELIQDKVKVIIHYGQDNKHCVSGTIISHDEGTEIIRLIPEDSTHEMELPLHMIAKIERIRLSSQHDLLPKHEPLVTDVDFDNAILLQLPVSVWHGGYRIRNASSMKGHHDQTVVFSDQIYDKRSFLFRVERTD